MDSILFKMHVALCNDYVMTFIVGFLAGTFSAWYTQYKMGFKK